MYTLICDGGCKGKADYKVMYGSYMILDGPDLELATVLKHEQFRGPATFTGKQTDNIAEYTSLIEGLKALKEIPENSNKVTVIMNSRLVLNQAGGSWKVNKEHLRPLRDKARELLSEFEETVLKRVPRDLIESYLGH